MGERPLHAAGAEHPVPGVTEIMDVILDRYPELLLQHVHREPLVGGEPPATEPA